MPFVLRPAEHRDIPALQAVETGARVRYAALGDRFAGFVSAPTIAAERFAVGETVVAEDDGLVLGYVLMQDLDDLTYIANIAVHLDHSGRGIGAALLKAADGRALTLNQAGVSLTTFRAPPWNGPWFRRFGYGPMPLILFGEGMNANLRRHATFLDMSMRETLFKPAIKRA